MTEADFLTTRSARPDLAIFGIFGKLRHNFDFCRFCEYLVVLRLLIPSTVSLRSIIHIWKTSSFGCGVREWEISLFRTQTRIARTRYRIRKLSPVERGGVRGQEDGVETRQGCEVSSANRASLLTLIHERYWTFESRRMELRCFCLSNSVSVRISKIQSVD